MAPQMSLDDWSFNDTSNRKAMHASPIMSQMPFFKKGFWESTSMTKSISQKVGM